ncbi:MAG TPA: ABC transporter ATP-binding protein [Burkholderiales bacterium]|nr:ABC transporter ATP-binding protein [Burkholderiales bacterium]
MAEPALLAVRGLTKRFGGIVANSAIDLVLPATGIHAVIGPNGAGKTTFIAQLCGELMPDAGSVHFRGADITRWPPYRRARAGLMRSFQVTSIMPSLTALEHTMLAVRRAPQGAAREALQRVGLAGREDTPAHALSHGERRQLELAMVIAPRPRLLLLDEPAAGTGKEEALRTTELIAALGQDHAILLVEHDMDMVFALAQRITVLANGACIASGAPAEIRDNAAVKQAYLGD